jgi:hypothetical protein
VRAWYHQATRPTRGTRAKIAATLLAVGRWLVARHPDITMPAQWDEALALEYVHYACTAPVGDDCSPRGRRFLAARGRVGQAPAPRTVDQHLHALRRAFADWQQRPHAVGGAAACTIPIRFNPLLASLALLVPPARL